MERHDGNVRFIRIKSRDSCNALRLKKRNLTVDVRRQRLEEVVKKLKASKLNFNHFSSSGQDGVLQKEAACTLVNLALGTEEHCMEVCKQAGVYLILHLGNSNPELQDPCAWCIGNLCGYNRDVCLLLASQGLEEVFVKALSSHAPHVLQSAAYALTQYLTTLWHKIRPMAEAPVVRRLVNALSATGGLPEVGWCLFALSAVEDVCHLLVDQGIIATAFNVLEKLVNEEASPGVVEDLNLKPRLEPALRRALAAHFTLNLPEDPELTFSGVL
ncbi:hypothetical protein GWK47_045384 [Chionoecetes opilio]|uniref:IBB domain-containing protein n=1 Tax=Chionoecetes opilio TaxID=41210 RepID=A0A8J5CU77_CHIOP|nr:hypothetical protein GWK47_045384 [Chionoecetes opilio]